LVAGAGIRLLEVEISYSGERPRVRSRRSDHRLRVFVDRPDSSLPSRDPAPLAREVAEEVVALVRHRTGLGPHPEFASTGAVDPMVTGGSGPAGSLTGDDAHVPVWRLAPYDALRFVGR
jgi:hypothetical protein